MRVITLNYKKTSINGFTNLNKHIQVYPYSVVNMHLSISMTVNYIVFVCGIKRLRWDLNP